MRMHRIGFHRVPSNRLVIGGLLAALLCGSAALLPARAADDSAKNIPDFMAGGMGWNSAGQLTAVPGSPSPVVQDPKIKYVPNNVGGQPTWRVADVNNPNLTQFAKDGLKKANDMVAEGFAMYNRTSRCWQPGAAVLNTSPGRTYFLQTPKEVSIIWQRDQIVRHVYLNVPHSANPKPSWNGESVGHYEGDTLVVDTIGLNDKSFVDNFRTPHTEKLHVVERLKLVDDGKALEVSIQVEDPDAFYEPWAGIQRYDRVQRPMREEICAEGNRHLFHYVGMPVAEKPDF